MDKRLKGQYDDIIDCGRPPAKGRKKMSLEDRAAQFAPFAAVVGHKSAVKETARLTDQKKALDETQKLLIDKALQDIEGHMELEIEVIYFLKDPLKSGGQYLTCRGWVRKIDSYRKEVHMEAGLTIAVEDIYSIHIERPGDLLEDPAIDIEVGKV